MEFLEAIDTRDRQDGTPRRERLRQIPPKTGKFLAIMAAAAPEGELIEIGTSAGYSTLWLALACRATARTITTFEVLPPKVQLAQATFEETGTTDVINLVAGDARDYIAELGPISFCFLDAEKEVYGDCYELVVPKLVPGGLLVADNAINHRDVLQPMLDRALTDTRVDAIILSVGNGELVCRKI
ncbi:MAG: class I SAM-dependent methyltransferase [Candidatus Promineifilaceae bacterium]|nr:class I SAM-dependent methyltransferase [Candidatus Promineifilaceae bacterium]